MKKIKNLREIIHYGQVETKESSASGSQNKMSLAQMFSANAGLANNWDHQ